MWLFIVMVQLLAVDLASPLELGRDPAEITLIAPGDEDLRRRVGAVAADPRQNLVLRLGSVEADAGADLSWEVYVASSGAADRDNLPALAGILSLYGMAPGADFVLPLDAAVVASEPVGLKVLFRPTSGREVDTESVAPVGRITARIGAISLEAEMVGAEQGR